MVKPIALYIGPGAELAKDVEVVLQKNQVDYGLINSQDVRHGVLAEFRILIMPGGYTANYIPGLKKVGCKAVQEFLIQETGFYIGICAGAYIAGTTELGISKSELLRKSGIFNCEIEITVLTHPIFDGFEKSNLTVYYQNGPHIHPHKEERSLALYSDGTSSVIETDHALIFSWHPERLPHTHPILLNSLDYLSQKST